MMSNAQSSSEGQRTYRVDMKRCVMPSCDGEVAELSYYYERNNWATVGMQCNRRKRKFTVKVEK